MLHMLARRARAAAAIVTLAAAASAHAGLFDDEEARKAIVDLRTRISEAEEASKARHTEVTAIQTKLTEQLTEQLAVLRRSLIDLNNQLEAMRAEMAKLRGTDEQLVRDVSLLQQRQRDFAQTLDDRLRKLEPVKVTIDGREHQVSPEEKKAFEDAMAIIRTGDFDQAVAALANFQRRYAGSPYTNQARFWLGNALYGKRDYKEAIEAFRVFVTGAPAHPRAPEALLAVANSQAEMKDIKSARKTLEDLMKAYPQSDAAATGRDRLAALPAR